MRIFALAPLLTLAAAAPVEERRYMLTNFDRLRVEGPFEVEIVTGAPRAAAIGSRAALDRLAIRVDAGTLVINGGAAGTPRPDGTIRVRVGAPALRAVAITGGATVAIDALRAARVDLAVSAASSVQVGALRADDLRVTLTGQGAATLAGATKTFRARNLGSGTLDAAGVVADDADLVAQGDGGIRVTARYTARATALGSGPILVSGHPRCTVKGSGPITCAGTTPR